MRLTPYLTGQGLERARDLLLILFVLFASCWNFAAFRSFVFEDSYITYRYAENIAAGRGFVFNEGERVLGTSTPLYALLLALLRLLGADLEIAGGVVTVSSLALVALGGSWLLRRFGYPNLAVLYAVIALWGAGGILFFWGMETTFYIAVLFGGLISALERRQTLAGVFIGLACLTRYDAVLFAGIALLLLWIRQRAIPWRAGVAAAVVVLPWSLFSILYFGSLLPNTLGAKSQSVGMFDYLGGSVPIMTDRFISPVFRFASREPYRMTHSLWILVPLFAPVLLKGAKLFRKDVLLGLLLFHPAALWLGYAYIGPPLAHKWYLVPGMYLLLSLSLLAWGELVATFAKEHTKLWATAVSLLTLTFSFLALPKAVAQEATGTMERVHYRTRVEAYQQIAAWIEAQELTELLLLTSEPGYLGYLTGNPVIDGAGLITEGLRSHGPKDLSTPYRQILKTYRPDLVIDTDHGSRIRQLEGFFPVFQTRSKGVFIAREALRRRFDSLAEPWLSDDPPPLEGSELRHPIDLDFEDGEAGGFWGAPRLVGHPFELPHGPEGASDPYLTTHGAVTRQHTSVLLSPPFLIDFDELSFYFAAVGRRGIGAQLVVECRVVLSIDATEVEPATMTRVRWPVGAWRGKRGELRFIDRVATWGALAADHIRSHRYGVKTKFDDFEEGVYTQRWTTRFGERPASAETLAVEYGPRFVVGRHSASSLGLEGRQRLVSAPFPVEHGQMSLLVLDVGGRRTAVKLQVGGRTVRRLTGGRSRALRAVIWDTSGFLGQEATLVVVDNDERPEQGIGVDQIVFADPN